MTLKVGLLHLPNLAAPSTLSYFEGAPPLGLAYIAAALRAAGFEPFVLDALGEACERHGTFRSARGDLALQGFGVDEIVERIPDDLDVLGIGNLFLHELRFLQALIPRLAGRRPDLAIILGGENATGMWEDHLRLFPQITGCILGEGEQAFPRLLQILDAGAGLEHAPSFAYRVDGSPRQNPRAPRVTAIDDLPWPAWDLFPVENYLAGRIGSGVDRGPSLPVLTSRGCPYTCAFCSAPGMWGTTYVARTPARLLDEIEHLMQRYGVTNVDLRDLSAVLTKRWARDFHAAVIARGLRFTWQIPQGTRSENLRGETLEWMYQAGCRNIGYALESVSPAVITRMRKRVVPERLFRSVGEALRTGLRIDVFLIVGYPGETRWDHLAYLRAVLRLAWKGVDAVSVMQFNPYPGSEDYRRARQSERIRFDDDRYVYSSLFRTTGRYAAEASPHSDAYLIAVQRLCMLLFWAAQFAVRPWRLLRHVRNVVRRRQETVLDQFLAVKVRQWRRRLTGATATAVEPEVLGLAGELAFAVRPLLAP